MADLAGKVALVTGASKGIGAAIAVKLAEQGAAVVVNYGRSAAEAQAVVDGIRARGGRAIAVQADVSKTAEIAGLFRAAIREFGKARHPG